MNKPILCLDFDGVIHSYTSGWKGADVIPDPPVPGTVEFLEKAVEFFDVQVFSSRSNQPNGIEAMAKWLWTHITRHFDCEFHHGPHGALDAATKIMGGISWPKEKPPALVTLDDRAITFTGQWPAIETLKTFKPWNKA